MLLPDKTSGKTLLDRIVMLEVDGGVKTSRDPFDLGSLGISLEDPEVSTLKQRIEDQEKKMERMMERIVQMKHSMQSMSLGGVKHLRLFPSLCLPHRLSRILWPESVTWR